MFVHLKVFLYNIILWLMMKQGQCIQVQVFLVVMLYCVVVGYQHFRECCCPHLQGDIILWHHNPEGNLNLHHHEHPKSHNKDDL